MARPLNTILDLWCNLMHNQPTWPISGKYYCRKCWRPYVVPWANTARHDVDYRAAFSKDGICAYAVGAAHETCAHSIAIRGNIEVTTGVVTSQPINRTEMACQ
jgi:hypothetical protein